MDGLGTRGLPTVFPAADVKVVGFCYSQPFDRGARIATRTDAAGKYRVVVPASGGGAFWLVPDDACPFGVVVSKEGGDLGTQTLKRGPRPSGQVLDVMVKPSRECTWLCRGRTRSHRTSTASKTKPIFRRLILVKR